MNWLTHMTTGSIAVSLGLQTADLTLVSVGAVAALLPDIDTSKSMAGRMFPWVSRWLEQRLPHRSCTHSLLASGVVAIATYPAAIWLSLPLGLVHAVNIGYFTGWFADMFTKSGVEMFYPDSARWVVPGNRDFRLATNSPAEYVVLVVLMAIAVFTFSVNANGGIMTQFNRLIGSPTGVEQLYDELGGFHLMVAHIKGVRARDRKPVQEDFWIIESHGQGFVVQGADGAVYKAGTEPDVQIIARHITADAGPNATTLIEAIRLNDDGVRERLEPFNRPSAMVFVSGQMTIDDPEGLAEVFFPDPLQFPFLRALGANVTLELAPLSVVQLALGDQFAIGQLSIKSIYTQSKASSGSSLEPIIKQAADPLRGSENGNNAG